MAEAGGGLGLGNCRQARQVPLIPLSGLGSSRFKPGMNILRVSWNTILIGTQDGFVHVFDREGTLQRTFQVGKAAVSDLLVSGQDYRRPTVRAD